MAIIADPFATVLVVSVLGDRFDVTAGRQHARDDDRKRQPDRGSAFSCGDLVRCTWLAVVAMYWCEVDST
jgi:hypothetical protein